MKHKIAPIQEAIQKAEEINKNLTAYDFDACSCVQIEDEEGSSWFLHSAFVLRYKSYYLVFAEHHDTMVFHKDDVTNIQQLQLENMLIKNVKDFEPIKWGDK
ncbi:hypothetical protein C4565_00590 [Candidatus Parcubacteria bacterium]|nr:MAG: hypothetical protein C4565_00590 [Candidatus Parcubacteria bacterium]